MRSGFLHVPAIVQPSHNRRGHHFRIVVWH
jgi:hypothetical protein